MSSSGRSSALLTHPGLPVAVEVRPLRSARRMRLRFDEQRAILKLTCPARTSRRSALDWAATQRSWVDAQIARAQPGEPFVPGAIVPLEGEGLRPGGRQDDLQAPPPHPR